jgi:hypothetical protein
MAHPESDAVDAPTALYDGDVENAFGEFLGEEEVEETPEDEEVEQEPEEAQDDEEEDEPEPAIVPPSSLTAEEKAEFANLDPEARRLIAEIEGRRNAQVTRVTTEAAEAKRQAETTARAQFAQETQNYAAELERYAAAFKPQMPDPALAYSDPQTFAYEMAQYQQLQAHSEQLAKQADGAKRQADTIAEQNRQEYDRQQYRALIQAVPEWSEPEKMSEALKPLLELARAKGFDDDALQSLSANDVLFLKEHNDLLQDRAELQKLRGRNMERVRSFKGTAKPGVAQARQSGAQKAHVTAIERLKANPHDQRAIVDAFAAFE